MVLVGLLACVFSPSALAKTRFHVLSGAVARFASDGLRYVAWQAKAGAPVNTEDTATGRQRTIHVPYCELPTPNVSFREAAGGMFLLACPPGGQQLLDVHSGKLTPLPQFQAIPSLAWWTVGERAIEGAAEPGACGSVSRKTFREASCLAYLPLPVGSGPLVYRPASALGDVDRAGAPTICAGLRPLLLHETEDQVVYRDGIVARAVHANEAVEVRGCHGHAVLLQGHGIVENIELGGGILTWDTGRPGDYYLGEENEIAHGRLYLYNLATRRERSWALPQRAIVNYPEYPHGTMGVASHTRTKMFWLATRTLDCNKICSDETWTVLSASSG